MSVLSDYASTLQVGVGAEAYHEPVKLLLVPIITKGCRVPAVDPKGSAPLQTAQEGIRPIALVNGHL